MVSRIFKESIKEAIQLGSKELSSRYLRAALTDVTPEMVPQLVEILGSSDFVQRILLTLPLEVKEPEVISETLLEALKSSHFRALSENLRTPIPLSAWVRGFSSIWEERLQARGLAPAGDLVAKVVSQILSAMLEV